MESLEGVPLVRISPQGKFKYILIDASVGPLEPSVTFVRGNEKLNYHADNFQAFSKELEKAGWQIKGFSEEKGVFVGKRGERSVQFKCPGGGRIEHRLGTTLCSIYGYSKSYGRVDHQVARELIAQQLGYDVAAVAISDEGY